VIVVDTSVVVQWVAPEDAERRAEVLLGRDDLAAPDVLLVETANVLRKKARDGDVTRDQAFEGMELVEANVKTLVPTSTLLLRAMQLAFEMNHPVYDCLFLACAEMTGTVVLTRDRRLAQRAADHGHAGLVSLFPDEFRAEAP